MSYHTIEEKDSHFILQHKNGHEIKIAKKALSPKTMEKIKSFAEGGQVDPEEALPVEEVVSERMPSSVLEDIGKGFGKHIVSPVIQAGTDVKDAYGKIASSIGSLGHGVAEGAGIDTPPAVQSVTSTPDVTPQLQNVSLGTPAQSQQPQMQVPDLTGPYQQASQQVLSGLAEAPKVAQAQGAAEAKAYGNEANQQEQLLKHTQESYQALDNENAKIKQDVLNGHLDPKRLFHNMNTGQKILTGLGVLLGGISTDPNHQNRVMDFINRQVDLDLDAQRAELGKNNTLLENNLKQYGNLKDATAATRLQYMSALEGQLGKIASTYKGAATQAAATQAAGQFKLQTLPTMQELAFKQAALKGMQSGNPASAIQYLVPEKQREDAYKELQRVQNAKEQATDIMSAFHKTNQENTVGGRLIRAGSEPAAVGNMENLLLPLIKDREGRINEFEFQTIKKFIPKPGDLPGKVKEKEMGLQQFLKEKMNSPMLQGLGIPVPQVSFSNPVKAGFNFKQIGMKH